MFPIGDALLNSPGNEPVRRGKETDKASIKARL